MITSISIQDGAGTPVVLCNVNARTKEKRAAACYAAKVAYLRSLYGHQPAKGVFNGFIHRVEIDGAIVVVEVGFQEYGYCTGMFELPIHVFKFQGRSVSSSTNVAHWVGRPVVLKVINRYKFNDVFLSHVTAVNIDGTGERMELPPELSAEAEV